MDPRELCTLVQQSNDVWAVQIKMERCATAEPSQYKQLMFVILQEANASFNSSCQWQNRVQFNYLIIFTYFAELNII